MSRVAEIAQGLRHEDGALTFSLDAEEYQRGYVDFCDGVPAPRLTTDSYDLGRALGQRRKEEARRTAEVLAAIRAEDLRRRDVIRELLRDKPDDLAEFNARMDEIDSHYAPTLTSSAPTPSVLPS